MKEKTIKVLMVEPHQEPRMVELDNDLDALQKAVSIGADEQGLIELLYLEDNVSILCNEEGKLIGFEPNRRLGRDILCGVFYVVAEDEQGNLASLTEEQQDRYAQMFRDSDEGIGRDEVEETLFMTFV